MLDASSDFQVVVPAHQAADTLGRCLQALIDGGVDPAQIVVVDDGSTDQSGQIARDLGAHVIRNDEALRPAKARNAGVAACTSDLVVFVDADVVPHADALPRLLAAFEDPSVSAAFGSYDTKPEAPSIVSRYRNLLHFHVHQTARPEAETFWTGLGAARRARFEALGGFASEWENIEDVEFGVRLRAEGDSIRIVRDAQGTHLKDWTVPSMFKTDLFGRAVPWTRLIMAGRLSPETLNGGTAHRASALCVLGFVFLLLVSPFWGPSLFWALVLVCCFVAINARFLISLYRIGGLRLAVGAVPYHALHYLAASLGYGRARLVYARDG
ncbi:glycosyltransferase [Roseobacter sinensis]|uniref:Glycosyltransferase n=1 Tax=Roseobacter sinensis TaxID=2931391 RepID=A0ABT3BJX8_9RHOB|nr:glycosyltransferase [Roseobacter sp. WL0113]MCV3273404.1 glycosyltransferase [Roseobacter sp. WL0113]